MDLAQCQMQRTDVLIPHQNDIAGFEQTLNSINEQSWSGPLRVVVVDDGSEREALLRLEKALETQSHESVLLRNQENRGRPYSRNRLLDAIDSPWVSWIDCGDVWYPTKLQEQFSCLCQAATQRSELDHLWVTCDYDWHWLGRGGPEAVEQVVEAEPLRDLVEGKRLRAYLWTLLGSARSMQRIGHFDEKLPRQQDLDFFLRFVLSGGVIQKPNASGIVPLCRYEKSDAGRDPDQIHDCNLYILSKHAESLSRYGKRFVTERKIGADLLAVRIAKNNGDYRRVLYYTSLAAMRDPLRALTQLTKKAIQEKK